MTRRTHAWPLPRADPPASAATVPEDFPSLQLGHLLPWWRERVRDESQQHTSCCFAGRWPSAPALPSRPEPRGKAVLPTRLPARTGPHPCPALHPCPLRVPGRHCDHALTAPDNTSLSPTVTDTWKPRRRPNAALRPTSPAREQLRNTKPS